MGLAGKAPPSARERARERSQPSPSPRAQTSGPPRRRDRILWSLAIFACALAVRGLEIWQLSGSLLFETIIGDGRNYDLWAKEIVGGEWIGSQVFYQAPLYPYFLALVYAVAGVEPLALRVVQAALGAASCLLLARAGWRFFSAPAGIVAGFLLALYAPAGFSDISVEKSVLDIFFVCLLLWALGGIQGAPRARQCLGLGLSVGALALTRENALVFAAVLLPWLCLRPAPSRGRRLVYAAACAAGTALVLAPVALRNAWVGDGFYLTTSQLGPNFYIGNNAAADGTYRGIVTWREDPRLERQDAFEVAERALGRKPTPAEVSAYFTGLALDYIRSQPGDWLALLLRKTVLAFNSAEMVDTKDQYSHADLSSVLRATGSLFHFGLLAPLAMLGVFVSWPDRRRLLPLHLLFLAYTATLILFYVLARYRIPLVPILALFAAAGIVGLPDFLRRSPAPRIAAGLAATTAAALLCNWRLVDRDYMRSVTQYNLGNELFAAGRSDAAALRYREAIRLYAGNAQAHHNLGALYAQQGDLVRARPHYEQAVRISPQAAQSHVNLARTLAELGDLPGAVESYRAALRLSGERADLHAEMGRVLEAQGDLDAAIESFERALRLDPGLDQARRSLARARAARAERAGARRP
jgi:tetratricopeptide (TPR) repeat protein